MYHPPPGKLPPVLCALYPYLLLVLFYFQECKNKDTYD